jgi:cytoskeletal protein CcmA (bactofilin family)
MTVPKEIDTMIGKDSIFEGVFQVKGILLIEGRFKGDLLYADQIYIAPSGQVDSNIKGGAIFVEGQVKGNIQSDNRVILLPGSRIIGDITTPELITQKGVVLQGKCNITQNQ